MPQQNNMMMGGEVRPGMTAPDETMYNMSPDTASAYPNQWIYGDPGLGGQGGNDAAPGGMDSAALPDAGMSLPGMVPGGPSAAVNGAPMPGMPMGGMNGEVMPGGMSSSMAQSQRMKNPLNMEQTHMPSNASESFHASLRSLLHRNIGYFIRATFLVGTQQSVTWQGILHTVGSDYIVLYQPNYERYISCDLYALKFVQFHDSKNMPYCVGSQNWQGQSGMM